MWGEMQDLPPERPRLTYEAWCQRLPGQPHPAAGGEARARGLRPDEEEHAP